MERNNVYHIEHQDVRLQGGSWLYKVAFKTEIIKKVSQTVWDEKLS